MTRITGTLRYADSLAMAKVEGAIHAEIYKCVITVNV